MLSADALAGVGCGVSVLLLAIGLRSLMRQLRRASKDPRRIGGAAGLILVGAVGTIAALVSLLGG